MAILNPVVSKFNIAQNTTQEVYICPSTKTYSLVDLTFFKENTTQDSVIAVALTTESNSANLTSVDFFIDNIKLTGATNSAELSKLIVGQNERIYAKVVSGPDVTIRLAGVEDTKPKVIKAGRLAASSIASTAQTEIYSNTLPNVSYITCSVTIFNTSNTNDAIAELWITSSETPSVSDKILKVTIPSQDTTILENILMLPNEKIFVKSSQANTEYFINGTVVSST